MEKKHHKTNNATMHINPELNKIGRLGTDLFNKQYTNKYLTRLRGHVIPLETSLDKTA